VLSQNPKQVLPLSEAVQKLVSQDIVEMIDLADVRYASSIFLLQKKTGDFRFITNLKPLNQYLVYRKFKMEQPVQLKALIREGTWFASFDLKDAYPHIPLATASQGYVTFKVCGKWYKYKTLPFGVASAPRVFTKLCRVVAARLRAWWDVRLLIYIDDILVWAETRDQCRIDIDLAIKTFLYLGFQVNLGKSQLDPVQRIKHLGWIWDSVRMEVSLPADRADKALKACACILRRNRVTLRDLASMLSTFSSMLLCYVDAPLHFRALQAFLNQHLPARRSSSDYNRKVSVTYAVKLELLWWEHRLQEPLIATLRPWRSQGEVSSDACDSGWGAACHGLELRGQWSFRECTLHINEKELLALDKALSQPKLLHYLTDKAILFQLDSQVATRYLDKRGGRIPSLNELSLKIHDRFVRHRIRAHFLCVKTHDNFDADCLSRDTGSSINWSLSSTIRTEIFSVFGIPQVDLFATYDNRVVGRYYSWMNETAAEGSNALAHDWNRY
jgi:hypothetical protein